MISTASSRDARLAVEPAATTAVPAQWPKHLKTCDGAEYRVRPIRADDVERDRLFIRSLSSRSLYNRMMGPLREPPAELLVRLTHVDYEHDMALVAVVGDADDETIIAVARYGGTLASGEFAVAVADAWQARGVGAALSLLLFDYAKSHGVQRLCAFMFAHNYRMLKLADYLHMQVRRSADDDTVVEAWRTL